MLKVESSEEHLPPQIHVGRGGAGRGGPQPDRRCLPFLREVLDLDVGQYLRQRVGRHVLSGAIGEGDVAVFDGLADEVVADVDVLGAGMEGIVFGERDGRAIVGVETDREGGEIGMENISEDVPEPHGFLRGVRQGDVLRFRA